MMYEMFVNELMTRLEQMLDNVVLERKTVRRINREVDGITIRPVGSSIAPVFYLDGLYEDYKNGAFISQLARYIAREVRKALNNAPSIPQFSKETAIDNLYCAVINAKDNEELLENVPHRMIEDLAIIPRFRVGEDGSFLIRNEHCGCLNMTAEELLEIAQANTDKEQFVCVNLSECISDLICAEEGIPNDFPIPMLEPSPMFVLTNKSKVNGAVAITSKSALRKACDTIGGDFFILPSSRHELILLKKDKGANAFFLKNLVQEVNSEAVAQEDKLSDNVYFYNSISEEVEIVA